MNQIDYAEPMMQFDNPNKLAKHVKAGVLNRTAVQKKAMLPNFMIMRFVFFFPLKLTHYLSD